MVGHITAEVWVFYELAEWSSKIMSGFVLAGQNRSSSLTSCFLHQLARSSSRIVRILSGLFTSKGAETESHKQAARSTGTVSNRAQPQVVCVSFALNQRP